MKYDVKNVIFNKGIKYLDNVFVQRSSGDMDENHENYLLLLAALEGNEDMQEFIKMFYSGKDSLL